jgi:hypothetical protein
MSSQIRRESAQILQFPPPGLRAARTRSLQANPKQNAASVSVVSPVNTGAWYHEAAIVEEGSPRKA